MKFQENMDFCQVHHLSLEISKRKTLPKVLKFVLIYNAAIDIWICVVMHPEGGRLEKNLVERLLRRMLTI